MYERAGGVGAAAIKKDSRIVVSAGSAPGVEVDEASDGLRTGCSGLLIESEAANVSVSRCEQVCSVFRIPRFCRGGAATLLNVVSSNGRHLKSFLYPPQTTLRL